MNQLKPYAYITVSKSELNKFLGYKPSKDVPDSTWQAPFEPVEEN